MAQLSVLDFIKVKRKELPLSEAVQQRRAEDSEMHDKATAKRKQSAREKAREKAQDADKRRREETARKILDVADCKKDFLGYLQLETDQVYIGNAYQLAGGSGWASGSPWSVPKDLRSRVPAYGSVPNSVRDEAMADAREEYRRRILSDRRLLESLVRSLSGKRLVCTCRSDDRCHGPMLLAVIDEDLRRREEERRFNIIRIPQIVDPVSLLRN